MPYTFAPSTLPNERKMETITTRKAKKVSKANLTNWKKALEPYGAKAELSRKTGISVQTLRNILDTGSGLVENVEKIEAFFPGQNAA